MEERQDPHPDSTPRFTELIELARTGESPEAVTPLYERAVRIARTIALKNFRPEHGVMARPSEISQEVGSRVAKKAASSDWKNREHFHKSVATITKNLFRDFARKAKRRKTSRSEGLSEIADRAPNPANRVESLDLYDRVSHRLSEEERDLLLMRYRDGMTSEEIARIKEMTPKAIEHKITRAKARLRNLEGAD